MIKGVKVMGSKIAGGFSQQTGTRLDINPSDRD